MIKVLTAEFVTTATQLEDYPRQAIPEVAFVGRSNVGKSSMINTLAHRRKLVRVSNTPGRTKTHQPAPRRWLQPQAPLPGPPSNRVAAARSAPP